MGSNPTKAADNMYCQCRKAAAKYNDRLNSREGAAELLGLSSSSLADYELSITKVVPVDKVALMIDLYNAPELRNYFTYTAYDARWWLVKNSHDRIYNNMRADQIMADCCTSYGIPFGSLANTGVKFSTLHFVGKTLWDTIITALTETRKVSGKKYTTKMIKGKVTLVEKVKQVHVWVIEQGVNLIDSDYEESIEEMYTQVKVTGKDKSKRAISSVAKDAKAQSLYGTMQKIIDQTEVTTQAAINTIAAQQLKELAQEKRTGSVETIGINSVITGDAIYVVDKQSGLVGGFYIIADEHTVENRFHKMKLNLAWTDELPEIDYEPPQTTK